MNENEAAAEGREIHASIELTYLGPDMGLDLNIGHIADEDNPAVQFVKFLARNLAYLVAMAETEHANVQQALEQAKREDAPQIVTATPRLLGPDGKLVS